MTELPERDRTRAIVYEEIARIGKSGDRVPRPDDRLPDLGIDSLTMMELATALEDRLGVSELPIEDWLDAQASLGRDAFLVDAFVELCHSHL